MNKQKAEFQKLDNQSQKQTPSSFTIQKKAHPMAIDFSNAVLLCARHINEEKALRSLGTSEGGNHFIELDRENAYGTVMYHNGNPLEPLHLLLWKD